MLTAVVRSLLRVGVGLALALMLPWAAAAIPPACDWHWQLLLPADLAAPIELTLTLDAGSRSRTELLLPEAAEIALLAGPGTPALEAVSGRPRVRSVQHRPGDRLALRFMIKPAPAGGLQRGPASLVFAARALLPLPADRGSWQMCLAIDGLPPESVLLANQGQAAGGERLLRLQGPATLPGHWLVAAGRLQQAERRAEGGTWQVVLPADAPFSAEQVAELGLRQRALVRQLWDDKPSPDPGQAPHWLMLGLGPAATPAQGLVLPQAQLLRLPDTADPSALEALLLHTTLQAWLRERFGPIAFEPRPDEGMTAWFWDGFATFYRQRLRSATARHSLQAHADELSAQLQPEATGTAPWLAMRWHTALRAQGSPGLDAVLQRLQVPVAQARATGPLSAPLATHRLQAALRPLLAQAPSADLLQLAGRPAPTLLTPEVIGPCFRLDAAARRIQPASEGEPSEACRGWLDGSAPAVAAVARPDRASKKAVAQPGKAKKPGKATAKPSRKTSPKAAPKPARRPAA